MIDSPVFGLLLLAVLAAMPLVLRRLRSAAPDGLRVLGRTALHRNAVVAVVAVGDRRLLLGAGDRGVQLLAELEPEEGAPAPSVSNHDLTTERMDASSVVTRQDPDTAAVEALLGAPGSAGVRPGPGIGLLDRLRAMTVRVPPLNTSATGSGRTIRVPRRL